MSDAHKKARPLSVTPRPPSPVHESDSPAVAINVWLGSRSLNLSDDEVSAIQSNEIAAVQASKAITEIVGFWIVDSRSLARWRARRPVSA